jgi:hypothetical protein
MARRVAHPEQCDDRPVPDSMLSAAYSKGNQRPRGAAES